MFGYCATGNVSAATPPTSQITIEMTQAKIGRSIKNLANIGRSCSFGVAALLRRASQLQSA